MPTTTHQLSTRIKLKYDTYANWISADPVLLAGEVAIATVPDTETSTGFQNLPNIVFKVGDGSSKYSQLKFVSALAADVHAWAKGAAKPTYTAAEIEGIQSYIDDIIANTDNIQDTDTKYVMEVVDGDTYKYGLYSTNKAGENKTLVYTLDLSAVDTRLDNLEAALGDSGKVSQQIADAIEAVAHAEVTVGTTEMFSGYKQENGIVTMTKRTLGVANVDGLQAALDAKQDDLEFEGEYDATDNKVALKSTVTNAVAAITNAETEEAGKFVTHATQANGVVTTVKRALVESDIPALAQSKITGLADALAAKQDILVIADGYNGETNPVATRATVTAAVADLNGAMHFEGVVDTNPEDFTAEQNGAYSAGDVVLYDIYEYVFDGTKWWALGAEGIYQLKADAETKHDELQDAIDAVAAAKQDTLAFEGTYDATNNKAMTREATATAITTAIDALDVNDLAVSNQYVTAVKQENGLITVTRQQPAISHISGLSNVISNMDADIAGKQDAVTFADDYVAGTNNAATVATVTKAVEGLAKEDTAVDGQFVTAVSQANGIVSVTRGNITTDMVQQGTLPLVFDCGTSAI